MVDADSVENRLERLRALVETLDRVREEGRNNYLESHDTRLKAERALQLAIQICIDVGAHLISGLGLPPPDDYHGVFRSLRDEGLDPNLAERLMAATGTRNVLVHDYLAIDDEKVWTALEQLDDLRAFADWAEEIARKASDA